MSRKKVLVHLSSRRVDVVEQKVIVMILLLLHDHERTDYNNLVPSSAIQVPITKDVDVKWGAMQHTSSVVRSLFIPCPFST